MAKASPSAGGWDGGSGVSPYAQVLAHDWVYKRKEVLRVLSSPRAHLFWNQGSLPR